MQLQFSIASGKMLQVQTEPNGSIFTGIKTNCLFYIIFITFDSGTIRHLVHCMQMQCLSERTRVGGRCLSTDGLAGFFTTHP